MILQRRLRKKLKIKLSKIFFQDPPKDFPHENPSLNVQDCPFFGVSVSPKKQNIFSSNDTDKLEFFEKGIQQNNIFNDNINFDSEKK